MLSFQKYGTKMDPAFPPTVKIQIWEMQNAENPEQKQRWRGNKQKLHKLA